jgi:hypothetical protein
MQLSLTSYLYCAEFMKLRVTIEAIELAKALAVLDRPAARANLRYAGTLKHVDRVAGFIPDSAGAADAAAARQRLEYCRKLLERPERILAPWEAVEGQSAVRVPRRQALKVEDARLGALIDLLDILIGDAERSAGGKRDPREAGAAAEVAPLQRQRQALVTAREALAADAAGPG